MIAASLAHAEWESEGGSLEPSWYRPHGPHWPRISAALTSRLAELAGRDDILVTCRHGTRSGAPAAFFPQLAELEIDAQLFDHHLPAATIDPSRVGDEERYPVAWGVFTHEAAHAAHSRWETPPWLRGTAMHQAAELLEESRVEGAQIARRPQDRRWLRESARQLIFAEALVAVPETTWEAASTAGLLLGRRDAGVLDPDETALLATALAHTLGDDVLERLKAIWRIALTVADDDPESMLEAGRAWCEALGREPAAAPGSDAVRLSPAQRGEVAASVSELASRVRENDDAEAGEEERAETARSEARRTKRAEASGRARSQELARAVFAPGAGRLTVAADGEHDVRDTASPVISRRPPTQKEKAAAAQLARSLRTAAWRERTETTVDSAVPPGRLNMRQALLADAQLAAGVTPTATPWKRVTRRAAEQPPLRVGIGVDVSSSMYRATGPMASAAWIIHQATRWTDPRSRTATIAFDEGITAITRPGKAPPGVIDFEAEGMYEAAAEAIDALTAALDLDRPGAGRLLVIASDGYFTPDQAARTTQRIAALRRSGCSVLWLGFDRHTVALPGSTPVLLREPAQAAAVIAQAATTAVRTTRRH
ncbi:vWA domain-containing protein [Streptomyces sedi]|uniref:VWA domain-containing protein n=1 Tax=Streptomyces sedi TaxID=555059 RepID=A0A5C4UMB3_9ACTN|nr:vWA domain-containing protein [Streptomyces sedi]TNM24582.1 VWA domain-containing protein [Streptomyces sedi]